MEDSTYFPSVDEELSDNPYKRVKKSNNKKIKILCEEEKPKKTKSKNEKPKKTKPPSVPVPDPKPKRRYIYGQRKRKFHNPWRYARLHNLPLNIKPRKPRILEETEPLHATAVETDQSVPNGSSQDIDIELSELPPNPVSQLDKYNTQQLNTRTMRKIAYKQNSNIVPSTFKIELNPVENNKNDSAEVSLPKGNIIINSNVFQRLLDKMAVCKLCKYGKLVLYDKGKSGCVNRLLLRCDRCFEYESFLSVDGSFRTKIAIGDKKVPRRNALLYASVLGGRFIGAGHTRISLYHACLNITGPGATVSHAAAVKDILVAAEFAADESMERAKSELEQILGLNPSTNLVHAVGSFDGAYQQRPGKSGGGFSRYCFASVISVDSAKVLGYDVACNSCAKCSTFTNMLAMEKITKEEHDNMLEKHLAECPAKFRDFSSVNLESELAPLVLSQALDRGVLFTGLVCDGDNKTYAKLENRNPYEKLGWEGGIKRIECLSHVVKRIKIHLAEAQKEKLQTAKTKKKIEFEMRVEEGEDPKVVTKSLGDKYRGNLVRKNIARSRWNIPNQQNDEELSLSTRPSKEIRHLSDALCAQIASYYHLSVKRHSGDPDKIINAINAIPLHLGANDMNAEFNHRLCPVGNTSWCPYQAAKARKKPLPHHPNYLSEEAVDLVQDIFEHYKYNNLEFIDKISEAQTSNYNETLHAFIFRYVSKTEKASNEVMRLGAALAVIRFNDGFIGLKRVFELLEVPVGQDLLEEMRKSDNKRILMSLQVEAKQKKRFLQRQRRGKVYRNQIKKHGVGYDSGKFSGATKAVQQDLSEESDLDLEDNLTISSLCDMSESNEMDCETSQLDNSLDTSVFVDHCAICGEDESSGLIGIDLEDTFQAQDTLDWVQCDKCQNWFHIFCLGLDISELGEDWQCEECFDSNESMVISEPLVEEIVAEV